MIVTFKLVSAATGVVVGAAVSVAAVAVVETGSLTVATYTATEVGAFIAGASLLVTALAAGIVTIIKALADYRKQVDEVVAKVDIIAAKTQVIEGHVNSAASRDAAIIASQETQMGMLRETISNQEKAAVALALAKATTEAIQAAAPIAKMKIE